MAIPGGEGVAFQQLEAVVSAVKELSRVFGNKIDAHLPRGIRLSDDHQQQVRVLDSCKSTTETWPSLDMCRIAREVHSKTKYLLDYLVDL